MNVEMVKSALLWSAIINIAVLTLWGIMFMLLHDFIYNTHTKWFKLSVSTFDAIHYSGMGLLKSYIFVCNIVPYIVLAIIT